MNVAVWVDLSQTCGQQKFSRPTLFLCLVCSERSWKNVKRHLVDRVSPEGREDKAACRWASLAKQRPEEAAERGQGRAVQHCTSISFFLFFAPLFFKAFCPGGVRGRSVLLHKVDVSLRRERNLIQVENADVTFSHRRIWPTLARVAVGISYALQQAVFVMFSPFMPQHLW